MSRWREAEREMGRGRMTVTLQELNHSHTLDRPAGTVDRNALISSVSPSL